MWLLRGALRWMPVLFATVATSSSVGGQLITVDTLPELEPMVARVEAMVLEGVAAHRTHWERDSSTISACSVSRVIGDPANLYEVIQPLAALSRLIEKTPDPCGQRGERTPAFVVVNDVEVQEDTARVQLRVFLMDRSLMQTYTLTGPALLGAWNVDSMVMHGYTHWQPGGALTTEVGGGANDPEANPYR